MRKKRRRRGGREREGETWRRRKRKRTRKRTKKRRKDRTKRIASLRASFLFFHVKPNTGDRIAQINCKSHIQINKSLHDDKTNLERVLLQ